MWGQRHAGLKFKRAQRGQYSGKRYWNECWSIGIDQLLFRRLGNDDNCLNSSHSLRPSAFVNVLFVQAIIIIALVASKVVVYSLIDQHLLRFRAPILWINPWLCTVRVNPCTERDYTSLHTSFIPPLLKFPCYLLSITSSGKNPGISMSRFIALQDLIIQELEDFKRTSLGQR